MAQKIFDDGHNGQEITKGRMAKLKKNLAMTVEPNNDTLLGMVIDWCESKSIGYLCTPSKAEPQLIQLEQEGSIDAILSTDSDLVIFGAKNLLAELDFNTMEVCHFDHEEAFKKFVDPGL